MILQSLQILNYRNIHEASLRFSPRLNCLVGQNGQGKTNVLDSIYLLSFTKSAFAQQDSMNICHGTDLAMVQGEYAGISTGSSDGAEMVTKDIAEQEVMTITCGLKRGQKKQFRRNRKEYQRLTEHIGLIPLVLVSPSDNNLIEDGSDYRRKYMDVVLSQEDPVYLENLTSYSAILKQRNALLKQLADQEQPDTSVLEIYEQQMLPMAAYIYQARKRFIEALTPVFQEIYSQISGDGEQVALRYRSQLDDRDLADAFVRTRQRDLILGWTSQGVHKDELEMLMVEGEEEYSLKTVGSQGQLKTYLIAMKLAQALYLSKKESTCGLSKNEFPILLLDDVFDRLDASRVERLIRFVMSEQFGQIFLTDTDTERCQRLLSLTDEAQLFSVENGQVKPL